MTSLDARLWPAGAWWDWSAAACSEVLFWFIYTLCSCWDTPSHSCCT
jgi:hypothetical protein